MNIYELHSNPDILLFSDTIKETYPDFFFLKYRKQPEELKKREKYIALDPLYAYKYARFVLKMPLNPIGEDAIAANAEFACAYAKHVLEGPFPKGEEAISKSHLWASMYTEVLKKDFYYNGKLIANY